jgi:chitosanase
VWWLALFLVLASCERAHPPEARVERRSEAPVALDQAQRRRADAIVSVFENDSTAIRYDYVEVLGDGRGVTAGRAGFTSATGDLLEVVDAYARDAEGAPIARWLPRLRALASAESGEVRGLDGFADAWREAARDPRFRAAQDRVLDVEIYQPSLRLARGLGLRTALGLLVVYDAVVQHGPGDDFDGAPAIARRATLAASGSPATGVDEKRYLRAYLDVRRASLAEARDPATRVAWREALPRVEALRGLVEAGNWELRPPIVLAPWGTRHVIE